MRFSSLKIGFLFFSFCLSVALAEPTPWWEVNYNLNIKYPSMGDYRWKKGSDKIIVKGKAENRRSFYTVDPAFGDTVVYLDSSVFRFKGNDIPILRWSFSKDKRWMLIQSERNRIWRHSNKGSYYILRISDRSLIKVSKKNKNLRNVKISPDSRWVSYVRDDNNLYVYDINRDREKKLTRTGSETVLNGHYGWVYEEELSGYDGYRW